jgi:hypothetical protein
LTTHHGRSHFIHPIIQSDEIRHLRLAENLAVIGPHQAEIVKSHCALVEYSIICNNCSALSGRDHLVQLEAIDAYVPQAAQPLALVLRAEALSRVLQQLHVLVLGDGLDPVDVS